jgi:hypothetical protein
MPLHTQDEVRGGAFSSLAALDRLNDGVLGAAGGHAETVSGDADGLVVARVDGEAEEVLLFRGFGWNEDSPEERFGRDGGGVGDGNLAAGRVIHRERGEVLNQRAATPYVEDLDAEADGKDGLVEVVCVLEEKLINIFAGVVGRSALRNGILAVLLRVDVSRAAGEENGLAGVNQVGDLDWCGEEGNFDRLATTALDA